MDFQGEINRLLSGIPEWLGVILVTTLFGTIGVWYKNRRDTREKHKEEISRHHHTMITKLEQFYRHLGVSNAVFDSQRSLRSRLADSLAKRFSTEYLRLIQSGYDELFSHLHDQMSPEELEIFSVMRAQTMGAMRQANKQLLEWLDSNSEALDFVQARTSPSHKLEQEILQLHTHLLEWFSKYDTLFLKDERRCLVYMGDQKAHGTEFPKGIERTLRQFIDEHI
ncbi:MAG: hypothetical protein KJ065_18430 [Anaerolineae bacterium]|nr:hypothetical protein [Anaerolineae bacterium]